MAELDAKQGRIDRRDIGGVAEALGCLRDFLNPPFELLLRPKIGDVKGAITLLEGPIRSGAIGEQRALALQYLRAVAVLPPDEETNFSLDNPRLRAARAWRAINPTDSIDLGRELLRTSITGAQDTHGVDLDSLQGLTAPKINTLSTRLGVAVELLAGLSRSEYERIASEIGAEKIQNGGGALRDGANPRYLIRNALLQIRMLSSDVQVVADCIIQNRGSNTVASALSRRAERGALTEGENREIGFLERVIQRIAECDVIAELDNVDRELPMSVGEAAAAVLLMKVGAVDITVGTFILCSIGSQTSASNIGRHLVDRLCQTFQALPEYPLEEYLTRDVAQALIQACRSAEDVISRRIANAGALEDLFPLTRLLVVDEGGKIVPNLSETVAASLLQRVYHLAPKQGVLKDDKSYSRCGALLANAVTAYPGTREINYLAYQIGTNLLHGVAKQMSGKVADRAYSHFITPLTNAGLTDPMLGFIFSLVRECPIGAPAFVVPLKEGAKTHEEKESVVRALSTFIGETGIASSFMRDVFKHLLTTSLNRAVILTHNDSIGDLFFQDPARVESLFRAASHLGGAEDSTAALIGLFQARGFFGANTARLVRGWNLSDTESAANRAACTAYFKARAEMLSNLSWWKRPWEQYYPKY